MVNLLREFTKQKRLMPTVFSVIREFLSVLFYRANSILFGTLSFCMPFYGFCLLKR
jgi:hypothetical protein